MAKKKKPKPKNGLTFEQSLEDLESVVAELEGGELGLDEALEQYERGVARLKQCHQQLENAERRITLLSGVDAEGNPITEPFDDESGSLEEKAASRSKRRSKGAGRSGGSGGVDGGQGLF